MSGITDALGITNRKGEKAALNAAKDANAQANALSKEQIALMKEELQFQKDQYQDWKDIYGDLQENLGDYYKNMSADNVIAMNLTQQQRAYQEATKEMEREFAQRGLAGSNMEAATKSSASFQNANTRATIRASADAYVAEKQTGFLGIGLGQGASMLGNIGAAAGNVGNAYNTGVGVNANMGANFLNQSTNLGLQNMRSMASIIGTATGYASKGASK